MNGKRMLYIDQYGCKWYAKTVKELMDKIGCKHCEKMYNDNVNGESYHTGYVIQGLWLTAYIPYQKAI